MTMLMGGTISISVSNEIMPLFSIGESKISDAGQVAEDSLRCLPMDVFRVIKKMREGRNCVCDVRVGRDRCVYEAADNLSIGCFLHAADFCGIRGAFIL